MNENPSGLIEFTKIVTGFLSDNSWKIVIIVLLLVCREAISNLITRLTSISYKNGNSELGLNASSPIKDIKEIGLDIPNTVEKPTEQSENAEKEENAEDSSWFFEMSNAFDEKRFDEAEEYYKRIVVSERDIEEIYSIKAVYLYFRYDKINDNSAIFELEKLEKSADSDESRLTVLVWLSFCFKKSLQTRKEIQMWRTSIDKFISESKKTRAIINLCEALNRDEQFNESKRCLVDRLSIAGGDDQKSMLFDALSDVEKRLGNNVISVYCKDKSLEYDPSNKDKLFNAAYFAKNENVDDLSVGNYLRLLRVDSNNSMALNNLGVEAAEAGLETVAIEHYKKAESHRNSLAMANLGYIYLNSGFVDEAQSLVEKAIEIEKPHNNIHSLAKDIHDKKEKQNEEWKKLGEKYFNRQKFIRIYIYQYYLGNTKSISGQWIVNNSIKVDFKISDHELVASWKEQVGNVNATTYTCNIIGKISGSSFSGLYKKEQESESSLLAISGNTSISCIGYISEDGEKFILISKNQKDDFNLRLSRVRSIQDSVQ